MSEPHPVFRPTLQAAERLSGPSTYPWALAGALVMTPVPSRIAMVAAAPVPIRVVRFMSTSRGCAPDPRSADRRRHSREGYSLDYRGLNIERTAERHPGGGNVRTKAGGQVQLRAMDGGLAGPGSVRRSDASAARSSRGGASTRPTR